MQSITFVRAALVAALAAAACRHAPSSATPTPRRRSVGQRDDITRKDIQAVLDQSSTAYDIVKLLRPEMLLRRTVSGVEPTARQLPNELPGLHVHVDDVRVGTVDFLSTIPARAVASIQWLSPSDASTKYGNGHTAGVIAVATLGGRW
jgi:hypothetical protein